MCNGVFNFNFLALVFSEILGGPKFTLRALRPLDAPIGEIFLPKASTSQYLTVFLISTFQLQQFPRFQGNPKFTLGGPVPLCTPPSGKNTCVLNASTLIYQTVILVSTFYLLHFPRYYGVPNLHQRALRPRHPQRRNFCTQSEYFTISHCVFNFNILGLVVSEILGGSEI